MSRSAAAIAAKAFAEALEELHLPEDAPDLLDPAALGRRAALLATTEVVWGERVGPLFDMEQAKAVLRISSRQGVSDLAKRGRLLGLDAAGGRKVYPAFQFDTAGRPYPEIPKILRTFAEAVETPYTIASWFVTPQDDLEGGTPAAWMKTRREPERLFESARRAAARLAQ